MILCISLDEKRFYRYVLLTFILFYRLPDEWVPVNKFEAKRSISLDKLSPEAKQIVNAKLYPVDPTTSRKHKRKRTTTSQDYLHLKDNKPYNI